MLRTVIGIILLYQLSYAQNFSSIDFDPNKESNRIVESTLNFAKFYHYNGQLDEAAELLKMQLSVLEKMKANNEDSLKLLIYQGRILTVKSFITNRDYNNSIEVLKSAERILTESVQLSIKSDLLLSIGFALYAKEYNTGEGSYEKALNYLNNSMQIRKTLDDPKRLAESYIYSGIIYERMNQNEKAMNYYLFADSVAESNDLKLEESYSKRHLAFMYSSINDYEKALLYFLKSLKLREEIGYRVYLPFSYLAVGTNYSLMGELKQSIEYLDKAEQAAEEINAERVLVLIYLNQGDAYTQLGYTDTAKDILIKAEEISKRIRFERGERIARKMLKELN